MALTDMMMGDPAASGALMGLIGGFLIVFLVMALALYIYSSLALMAIAKKTKTENGWLAWIPIGNFYLMTQIAQVPWWTMFAFLLAFIPLVGGLVFVGVMCWWWWKISEALGKPGWWGVLITFVPVVNLVMMGILAWGK